MCRRPPEPADAALTQLVRVAFAEAAAAICRRAHRTQLYALEELHCELVAAMTKGPRERIVAELKLAEAIASAASSLGTVMLLARYRRWLDDRFLERGIWPQWALFDPIVYDALLDAAWRKDAHGARQLALAAIEMNLRALKDGYESVSPAR